MHCPAMSSFLSATHLLHRIDRAVRAIMHHERGAVGRAIAPIIRSRPSPIPARDGIPPHRRYMAAIPLPGRVRKKQFNRLGQVARCRSAAIRAMEAPSWRPPSARSCATTPWPKKVVLVLHNQVSPRDFLEIVCQKFREGVVQPPRGGKRGGSDACDAIEIRRARSAQAAV